MCGTLLLCVVAGCPSFFARLPVLGGLLRQVSLGTIKRLVEDLMLIVKKVGVEGGGSVCFILSRYLKCVPIIT